MLNSYEATRTFEKSNYEKSEGNENIHSGGTKGLVRVIEGRAWEREKPQVTTSVGWPGIWKREKGEEKHIS